MKRALLVVVIIGCRDRPREVATTPPRDARPADTGADAGAHVRIDQPAPTRGINAGLGALMPGLPWPDATADHLVFANADVFGLRTEVVVQLCAPLLHVCDAKLGWTFIVATAAPPPRDPDVPFNRIEATEPDLACARQLQRVKADLAAAAFDTAWRKGPQLRCARGSDTGSRSMTTIPDDPATWDAALLQEDLQALDDLAVLTIRRNLGNCELSVEVSRCE